MPNHLILCDLINLTISVFINRRQIECHVLRDNSLLSKEMNV
jgi:hypothetical protein